MLLNAGYLKPCNGAVGGTEKFGAELVNMEVKNIFSRYAEEWFEGQQPSISQTIVAFVENLLKGDAEEVSAILNNELLNHPSCHDFKEENSYHLFIYGILLAVSGKYTVYSNPESGKGRSDCLIKPLDKEQYAVVIEFKHCRNEPAWRCTEPVVGEPVESVESVESVEVSSIFLKNEAQKGLKQIDEKVYIHNLTKEGYQRILKYGIAFHKKNCEVAMETVK
jgi:hypothetical protein